MSSPALCLWCCSLSWGFLHWWWWFHTVRSRKTGHCYCWQGGSPCSLASLTCMAGWVVKHTNILCTRVSGDPKMKSVSEQDTLHTAETASQKSVLSICSMFSGDIAADKQADNRNALSADPHTSYILLLSQQGPYIHLTVWFRGSLNAAFSILWIT